ncbi:MAG: sarcosine oxidase subunit gamma family protein [Amaricoccus sp.]|uniref:sarcosine oxidase subunit gamma family protein n=1 Tax=Amaricoccus sp. TaxID=1872485 RepID=UPI0039E704C8
MSEMFSHRPALGPALGSGVTLTALPEGGHVVLLLTRAGAPAPDVAGLRPAELRPAGPGQWFVVGDGPADLAALRALPDVAVSDQSHGRVRIAVAGAQAAAMLAKGTAVDLDGLAVGASVTTLVGPLGVHLTRTGPAAFELMVLRSFAAALWHDLGAMAAEY